MRQFVQFVTEFSFKKQHSVNRIGIFRTEVCALISSWINAFFLTKIESKQAKNCFLLTWILGWMLWILRRISIIFIDANTKNTTWKINVHFVVVVSHFDLHLEDRPSQEFSTSHYSLSYGLGSLRIHCESIDNPRINSNYCESFHWSREHLVSLGHFWIRTAANLRHIRGHFN